MGLLDQPEGDNITPEACESYLSIEGYEGRLPSWGRLLPAGFEKAVYKVVPK